MIRTLVLSLLLASTANAASFHFDAGNSELGFTGDYGGEAVPGVFKQFSGTAEFDLTHPLATRFATEIEVASLDTDYPDRDDTLRGPEFFDIQSHPKASWASTGDCAAAGASLTCPGTLTLKGVSHAVPLQVTPSSDGRSIEGTAALSRDQFSIGSGEWADPETIANAVEIRFRLQLQP
jgi:polyisoprenoid-binding protein YceI